MPPTVSPTAIGRPTVLCVDDDPDVLATVARTLGHKFEVTAVLGGLDGLRAIWEAPTPFHVIVSDLRMPAMNGLGLLQCARESSPSTVRVLLTAYAESAAAVAAVDAAEVFLYLSKPFDPGELVAAVTSAAQLHEKIVAGTDKAIVTGAH